MTETTETNRDRVRRLVFGPLGFRHPARGRDAKSLEESRAILDGIADDLAYMSDAGLRRLAEMMRIRGEGDRGDYWPSRASFAHFAHAVERLPLDMSPMILSWFASVEGPAAIAAGQVVEMWDWIERHRCLPHCPPLKTPDRAAQARRDIALAASDNARRLANIVDRRDRGVRNADDDEAWARWYLDLRQRRCAAVERARAGKDAA